MRDDAHELGTLIGHMASDIIEILHWVWCALLGFAAVMVLRALGSALEQDWWATGFHLLSTALFVWIAKGIKKRRREYDRWADR